MGHLKVLLLLLLLLFFCLSTHTISLFQISTEAEGKLWSIETSSARNYVAFQPRLTMSSSSSSPRLESFGSGAGGSIHHSSSAIELGHCNSGYQGSEPLSKSVALVFLVVLVFSSVLH